MRKLALFLLALLMHIGVLAPAASAQHVWNELGGDPLASTRVEADGKLAEVLKSFDIPEPVRTRFLEAVKSNPEGKLVHLNPGDRLGQMSFGRKRLRIWTDVIVGRMTLERGVVKAVEAREWRVEYEGRVYVLILPEVCYNWSWLAEAPPPKEATPLEECAELFIPVQPGDKLTVEYRPRGYLPPPSACFAAKQGDGPFTIQPCLTCFDVITTGVTLRFSLEAITHEISVCIERDGKPSCVIVIEPSDWRDNKLVLESRYWKWENCTGRPDEK